MEMAIFILLSPIRSFNSSKSQFFFNIKELQYENKNMPL